MKHPSQISKLTQALQGVPAGQPILFAAGIRSAVSARRRDGLWFSPLTVARGRAVATAAFYDAEIASAMTTLAVEDTAAFAFRDDEGEMLFVAHLSGEAEWRIPSCAAIQATELVAQLARGEIVSTRVLPVATRHRENERP